VPVEQVPATSGGWYVVLCTGGDRYSAVEILHVWGQGEGLPPEVRDRLVDAAVDHLTVPYLVPRSSPAGTPDRPLVTGLDTWIWVEPAQWAPVSAQASIPVATVTAVASPTALSVDPGDGSPATTCTGPGEPWDGQPDEVPAPCGHRYHRTSGSAPGGTWPLAITVTWDITWTCNPGCGSGTGPPFVLTTTRPSTVHQIQTRLSR
jgi:hypothetical protein